jgi:hypothetical protein
MKGSFIDEGYAELEGNDTLYVYGNAYEKILSDENLQKTIRKVTNHNLNPHFLDLVLIYCV